MADFRSLVLVACLSASPLAALAQAPSDADVLATYADIALASYEDSLTTVPSMR